MVFIVMVIMVVVTAEGGPGQKIKTKWAVLVRPGWQESASAAEETLSEFHACHSSRSLGTKMIPLGGQVNSFPAMSELFFSGKLWPEGQRDAYANNLEMNEATKTIWIKADRAFGDLFELLSPAKE